MKNHTTRPGAGPTITALLLTAILFDLRPAEARPNLAPGNMRKLDRWEVLAFSGSGPDGVTGKAIGRVASPPEALLHAFLEFGKYKHWVPEMKGSREVRRSAKDVWAVLETRLPWPVRDAWVYVRAGYRAKRGRVYEVRWKMINGTMKRYEGRALIEPWTAEGFHSVITFQIGFEPKTAAPRAAIVKGARKVAEVFVHRLRMRVKALRKYKKMPKDLRARYGHSG